jgi:hypothetical protein
MSIKHRNHERFRLLPFLLYIYEKNNPITFYWHGTLGFISGVNRNLMKQRAGIQITSYTPKNIRNWIEWTAIVEGRVFNLHQNLNPSLASLQRPQPHIWHKEIYITNTLKLLSSVVLHHAAQRADLSICFEICATSILKPP